MTKNELEARELSKKPLKSNEILELDIPDISGLSTKALRVLASTLVSSSNKRIRRLLNAVPQGISENALRASGVLTQRIGEKNPDEVDVRFFSIKGKTRNELIRETRRMIAFQKMKSSTVKGALEVRQANERNVFGESREDAARRERLREKYLNDIARKMESAKNEEERKALEQRAREIKEKYAPPSGIVTGDFEERTGLSRDTAMSEIFKFYRRYEESHSKIVKDLGSDKILKTLGEFTSGIQKPFEDSEGLNSYLNETLPAIIESEWEELPATEDLQAEFFAAFENSMKTGEDIFREEDGWL